MLVGAATTEAFQLVGRDYVLSILLCCCAGLFVISVLTTVIAIRVARKNDALVELLLDESTRHSGTICVLSERLSNQYYAHQEKVSIEHIATLRSLLDLLPTTKSETPGG